MKARNNKTGEIVTNFSLSNEYGTLSYINSVGNLCVEHPVDGEWTIIEECNEKGFNWKAFRIETAKVMAASLMSSHRFIDDDSEEGIAKLAISYADELIRQLKEKH